MKPPTIKKTGIRQRLLPSTLVAFGLLAGMATQTQALQTKWGLTVVNINNPTPTVLVTNLDGSLSITTGGGDTYQGGHDPYSFTFAYQQVTGDFDICVQIKNLTATDPLGQDSPKASLMVRTSLDPSYAYDVQVNATPLAPSGRKGQIESVGRLDLNDGTDDLPGRMLNYGGDTTDFGYCTFPDVWVRLQRQCNRIISYLKTTNTTDFPAGFASNPGSTNGWQWITTIKTGTNFPSTLYVGLNTCAHNSDINNTSNTVTSTYDNFGPTPSPASTPSINGVLALPGNRPGAYPNKQVLVANFDASLPTNGMGYPADVVQSAQAAAAPIIWNSGGYGSVSRDIIASISGQTPGAFSFARYQAGAFDFLLNPRDPVAAVQNLGPYSNPLRERYSSGETNVAASQAWAPSPNYGFVFSTVHKNGQQWNDGSPAFYAATYVNLDPVAAALGYDMIGGHFRGGQFYTRTTKLVTGTPSDPSSNLGNLQRCAIPISVAWFPYDQGWKAGYFNPNRDTTQANSNWKRGDGWGLHSGTAVAGLPLYGGQSDYNNPKTLMVWDDISSLTQSLQYSGLATVSLPGVNSVNDGMLFTVGNDENNSLRGVSANNAARPDGSGWYVAVRDIETSKADPTVYATDGAIDAGSSFSFVYIPYNADNFVGGQIGTNGATLHGPTGGYSVTHLSTGRYAVTIPGKTGTNGVILLQNTGYTATPVGQDTFGNPFTNVVDNSYMSYEYGGTNTFIVESRYVDASGGGEGVVKLRDAAFNFVYVDFINAIAPPGTIPPVLTLHKTGNTATVSWTNGAGFILQKTSTPNISGSWVNVGTANPSASIALTGTPQFFRVRSP